MGAGVGGERGARGRRRRERGGDRAPGHARLGKHFFFPRPALLSAPAVPRRRAHTELTTHQLHRFAVGLSVLAGAHQQAPLVGLAAGLVGLALDLLGLDLLDALAGLVVLLPLLHRLAGAGQAAALVGWVGGRERERDRERERVRGERLKKKGVMRVV
jgi:hypothetical protein